MITIQQNSVGLPLRIRVKPKSGPFDPTGLTQLAIVLDNGKGQVWTLPAVFAGDPANGVLERITQPGDLPYYGVHRIQGTVAGGGRDLKTRVMELDVCPNLAPPPIILRAAALGVESRAPAPV